VGDQHRTSDNACSLVSQKKSRNALEKLGLIYLGLIYLSEGTGEEEDREVRTGTDEFIFVLSRSDLEQERLDPTAWGRAGTRLQPSWRGIQGQG
jgi:hypothetical protein